MKRFFYIALLLAMVSMIAGCCACRKGKDKVALVGTEWHLVRMMEREVNIQPEQFVFVFNDEGAFSGVGACNRMMGDYTLTGKGAISFGAVAATRMMCPDAELETRLSQILERTTHYEIDGDMLLLLSKGELQAVFQAVKKK